MRRSSPSPAAKLPMAYPQSRPASFFAQSTNALSQALKWAIPEELHGSAKTASSACAMLSASVANLNEIRHQLNVQLIGHDKLNQLRHVLYFKDLDGLKAKMKEHAEIIRPRFEIVLNTLNEELGGLGIGSWIEPRGGYFVSFETMDGCAKAVVEKCKEAGVVMTKAGATFPYGKDPKDSNIRIAPTFPSVEELSVAAKLFTLCVKLVSVEKLLEDM